MDCTDELSRLQAAFEAFLAAKGIPSTDTGATRVFRAFQTASEIVSRAAGAPIQLAGHDGGLVAEVLESSEPSRSDHHKRLSPRESEVVDLLIAGYTILEVSSALGLSANTVRNHVKNIYRKLRVRSQVALIAKLSGHAPPLQGDK